VPTASRSAARRQHTTRRVAMAILAVALGCGSEFDEPLVELEAARHLILITVDTYRNDHFLSSRGGVDLTPALRRLAETSLVFRRAISASNVTSPGVAAILTGLMPKRAGVFRNADALREEVPTLTATLKENGFATAAFVGNQMLSPGSGFDRNFDTYRLIGSPESLRPKGAADHITDAALAWLADTSVSADEGKRFFLWLHYMDPHGPYQPPASFLEDFPEGSFQSNAAPLQLLKSGDNRGLGGVPEYQQLAMTPPSRNAAAYLARYAGEVRFLDSEIGRFISELDRLGLTERSVLALTSDHGEALVNDHGYYFSHANGLTQDQIDVPLLLRCPGCPPGIVDTPVSTTDILPTVMERLGLPALLGIDGASLLVNDVRAIISQTAKQVAIREGEWKFVVVHKSGTRSLYDLQRDPGELRDLSGDRPEVVRRFEARLDEFMQRPVIVAPRNRRRATNEDEEQLRALGYIE
jgi:arylsulfatase A-like enzyme